MKTGLSSRRARKRTHPAVARPRRQSSQYRHLHWKDRKQTLKRTSGAFFVQSFGCRASQADGAAIEDSLETTAGFTGPRRRRRRSGCSQYLYRDACRRRGCPAIDSRDFIAIIPHAEILVTGCYAQRAPQDLAEIEGVRWVVGNSHKTQFADLVSCNTEEYHGQIAWSAIFRPSRYFCRDAGAGRARRPNPPESESPGWLRQPLFLLHHSECSGSQPQCASRSESSHQMQRSGTPLQEVVLSGINLGRWGRDLPGSTALHRPGQDDSSRDRCARLRISSVEPMDWSDELIELAARTSAWRSTSTCRCNPARIRS